MQLERSWRPLTRELPSLDPADAVLARDRSSQSRGELEQVLGGAVRSLQLAAVVGGDEEGRVQVRVAGVAPAAGLQPVTVAGRDRLLDSLLDAVDLVGGGL